MASKEKFGMKKSTSTPVKSVSCRVMSKSVDNEEHNYVPRVEDYPKFDGVSGCRITTKNKLCGEYRYIYPMLDPDGKVRAVTEHDFHCRICYKYRGYVNYSYVYPVLIEDGEPDLTKDNLELLDGWDDRTKDAFVPEEVDRMIPLGIARVWKSPNTGEIYIVSVRGDIFLARLKTVQGKVDENIPKPDIRTILEVNGLAHVVYDKKTEKAMDRWKRQMEKLRAAGDHGQNRVVYFGNNLDPSEWRDESILDFFSSNYPDESAKDNDVTDTNDVKSVDGSLEDEDSGYGERRKASFVSSRMSCDSFNSDEFRNTEEGHQLKEDGAEPADEAPRTEIDNKERQDEEDSSTSTESSLLSRRLADSREKVAVCLSSEIESEETGDEKNAEDETLEEVEMQIGSCQESNDLVDQAGNAEIVQDDQECTRETQAENSEIVQDDQECTRETQEGIEQGSNVVAEIDFPENIDNPEDVRVERTNIVVEGEDLAEEVENDIQGVKEENQGLENEATHDRSLGNTVEVYGISLEQEIERDSEVHDEQPSKMDEILQVAQVEEIVNKLDEDKGLEKEMIQDRSLENNVEVHKISLEQETELDSEVFGQMDAVLPIVQVEETVNKHDDKGLGTVNLVEVIESDEKRKEEKVVPGVENPIVESNLKEASENETPEENLEERVAEEVELGWKIEINPSLETDPVLRKNNADLTTESQVEDCDIASRCDIENSPENDVFQESGETNIEGKRESHEEETLSAEEIGDTNLPLSETVIPSNDNVSGLNDSLSEDGTSSDDAFFDSENYFHFPEVPKTESGHVAREDFETESCISIDDLSDSYRKCSFDLDSLEIARPNDKPTHPQILSPSLALLRSRLVDENNERVTEFEDEPLDKFSVRENCFVDKYTPEVRSSIELPL